MIMISYKWNNEKNILLKKTRGVSFEKIVFQIDKGNLLLILEHHNSEKYSGQKIMVVKHLNYIYAVPFLEQNNERFLKTIIPNRKLTKKYLK